MGFINATLQHMILKIAHLDVSGTNTIQRMVTDFYRQLPEEQRGEFGSIVMNSAALNLERKI